MNHFSKPAFAMAQEFCECYFKDLYDYSVVLHTDREHLHAHIVFNFVGFDGYKYRYAEANTTVKGNQIQFVKTLTMDTEAHVPNVQFFYTLSTPDSIVRDENGTVKDYTNNDGNEYTSAKTAVKNTDGTVSYTELFSGGDKTKVTGQPLFVTNTTSPASSTYKNPSTTSGTVSGGTTGVVTFYSGGDGKNAKAGGQTSKDAYSPQTYGSTTYSGSNAKKYNSETPTTTNLENTGAQGTQMKNQGKDGNSGDNKDQGKTSPDYFNGAGNGGSVLPEAGF